MTGSSSRAITSTPFPSWLHEPNEVGAASSIRVHSTWPALVAGSAARRIALQRSSLRTRKILRLTAGKRRRGWCERYRKAPRTACKSRQPEKGEKDASGMG